MENFDISVQRFDEFAEEFANRFADVSSYANSIDRFCELIGNDRPQILELACGPGNVTRLLKQRSPESRIVALDLAPRMIELAQKALPDVDFRVMDVRHISTIPEKFDAIMCSFCLPFLSKNDALQLIADCAKSLADKGVLYISTMEGDENRAGFETTSFSGDAEVYFNYYSQSDLENSFAANGFKVVHRKFQDYTETDGSTSTDLIYIGIKTE
jgi:ubiquinone/menaquinone biosynthesis C-methylase UbiE